MVKICNDKYPAENDYAEYFNMFPYELADFQKYSIDAIVNGRHVLVCAPTGSGKTTPAEFAVEFFVGLGKKVVYTTPIKALSNQKYYDFTQKFPNISVGLMTGDIKLNPTADVIICTAEILLNFLYNKNAENSTQQMQINIEEELAAVIMDEVHFINDEHRGKTWENTILMLPKHIQLVMLSATIDSPEVFAEWCEKVTEREVYLSSLYVRPVPLIHYTYLTTTQSIYKKIRDKETQIEIRNKIMDKFHIIKDDAGNYAEHTYNLIKKGKQYLKNSETHITQSFVVNSVLRKIKEEDLFPAIMFVFSKKNVERIAKEITANLLEDDSKIPYTMKRDCDYIVRAKMPNFEEYFALPEYHNLVALLEKGIGIHHASMLPILREIVEMMILEKKIKVLISTETFFIGLNCPIRTAIFTSLQKFDGDNNRLLYSAEYQQGSGRCGRKGIDTVGRVIHLSNLFMLPTTTDYKKMLCGKPQTLVSKFKFSYQLFLRILADSVEGDDIETKQKNICDYIKKSMLYIDIIKDENDSKIKIEKYEQELENKRDILKSMKTPVDVCGEYKKLSAELLVANNKRRKELDKQLNSLKDAWNFIENDIQKYNIILGLQQKIDDEKVVFQNTQEFIKNKVVGVLNILKCAWFIDDNYNILKLGEFAKNLSEIHCLILSEIIFYTQYFKDFEVTDIIGFLSVFSGIKMSVADAANINSGGGGVGGGGGGDGVSDTFVIKNQYINNAIQSVYMRMDYYQDAEIKYAIDSGELYDDVIQPSMVNAFIKWCSCVDENECKVFIAEELKSRGIPLGDFTKGVLKISAVCKELANVANIPVDLMHKLSCVDDILLKYIATSQSLYL